MTTKMEGRNNRIISEFFGPRLTALVWASRVSGLNVDDIIRACLERGFSSLTAELEFIEEHEDELAKEGETDIEREFSALQGVE